MYFGELEFSDTKRKENTELLRKTDEFTVRQFFNKIK